MHPLHLLTFMVAAQTASRDSAGGSTAADQNSTSIVPFFFALRDERTGTMLFVGYIANPRQ